MHTTGSNEILYLFRLRFWCCICSFVFFFYYFIEKRVSRGILSINRSYALFMGPTPSLTSKIFTGMCLSVGSIHCLRDSQTSFSNKIFIKNRSHGTIHTFKNYFTIIFSNFNYQFSTK